MMKQLSDADKQRIAKMDDTERKKIAKFWLEGLKISAAYADDEETEAAIRRVVFTGGLDVVGQ
jgi:hypothetical protein